MQQDFWTCDLTSFWIECLIIYLVCFDMIILSLIVFNTMLTLIIVRTWLLDENFLSLTILNAASFKLVITSLGLKVVDIICLPWCMFWMLALLLMSIQCWFASCFALGFLDIICVEFLCKTGFLANLWCMRFIIQVL